MRSCFALSQNSMSIFCFRLDGIILQYCVQYTGSTTINILNIKPNHSTSSKLTRHLSIRRKKIRCTHISLNRRIDINI